MNLDRHSLALAVGFSAFMAVTGVVSNLTAERTVSTLFGLRTVPVDANDVIRMDSLLRTPGVQSIASTTIVDSLSLATVVATAQGEDQALRRAHGALTRRDFRRATAIVEMLISQLEAEAQQAEVGDNAKLQRLARLRNQALLLAANVQMQMGEPRAALAVLEQISPNTPVNDFVLYLRAENHEALEEHERAADLFAQLDTFDRSPLEHRAIVRRAHNLWSAEKWEEADKALKQVLADYPLYPRRYLALWEHAVALDRLGKKQEAADAYHDTWFEFPFKKVGRQARARLAEFEAEAVVPSDLPSAKERYARYRQLRINKHWDLARELFTELQADYATENGHSDFEHDVEFQLALNDYGQREFTAARARLLKLVAAYEGGNRAGISRYLTYKYLSRTEDRLGNRDASLAALDKMSEGYGEASRKRARAEFYEDHGQYVEAREIYDELYSRYKKKGWHYTWLLYKSGKFEPAYENLTALAGRSYGRNRAKYLYWSARTLERAGKADEAAEIFVDLAANYERGYYGLQARNRLLDLQQRRSVAGQLVASAEGIANSADEVLDALEEAADRASASSFAVELDDPRSHQRHALWGDDAPVPDAWTAGMACDASGPSVSEFCHFEYLEPQVALAKGASTEATGARSAGLVQPLDLEAEAGNEVLDEDIEPATELDVPTGREATVPTKKLHFHDKKAPRVDYSTRARIYWDGRMSSGVAFARARDGQLIGPVPDEIRAYDEYGYEGGLERAAQQYGELFPELVRAQWLYLAGYSKGARWATRDVAIEYRELYSRWKPRRKAHELKIKRWDYWIDNRRRDRSGFWGLDSDDLRYPVPKKAGAAKDLLERQQAIHDARNEMRPVLIDAFKEVGDYYTVRKLALATKGWYREDPRGPARDMWMQAYPRAFPRLVVANAKRYGINPYLLWALMTVESSYNPDSLSTADALGLLQVIPKTGLKTAIMLGDEDFGPFDLLEEDVAVQHGAFYFSKLVRKFRGQELLAFAGYNGGPHRVGDWLEDRGDTMPLDEFVEEIPFNQARGYTKKVYRFVSLFLQLYEGRESGLYVGQNIRTDYRPDPNF